MWSHCPPELTLPTQYDEAVKIYRDAMEVWKSYEDNFKCDSLQVGVSSGRDRWVW